MDLEQMATFGAALLAVLALIMVIAWVLRRFFGGAARPGNSALRRRDRRLGIVEAAQIGNRHRLLLVRRDDREHLILIGGATELVIETGIPHPGSEAEVNIRNVEPRFGTGADRGGAGYRPAEERDTGSTFGRESFSRPSFGSAFSSLARDAGSRLDARATRGREAEESDEDSHGTRESDFGRGGSYTGGSDDRSRYARSEPSTFGREESDVSFDDRAGGYRPAESPAGRSFDDADRYDRPGGDSEAGREDEAPDRGHSRILSRFLKRDGS